VAIRDQPREAELMRQRGQARLDQARPPSAEMSAL
jgi:hypothetical protein